MSLRGLARSRRSMCSQERTTQESPTSLRALVRAFSSQSIGVGNISYRQVTFDGEEVFNQADVNEIGIEVGVQVGSERYQAVVSRLDPKERSTAEILFKHEELRSGTEIAWLPYPARNVGNKAVVGKRLSNRTGRLPLARDLFLG